MAKHDDIEQVIQALLQQAPAGWDVNAFRAFLNSLSGKSYDQAIYRARNLSKDPNYADNPSQILSDVQIAAKARNFRQPDPKGSAPPAQPDAPAAASFTGSPQDLISQLHLAGGADSSQLLAALNSITDPAQRQKAMSEIYDKYSQRISGGYGVAIPDQPLRQSQLNEFRDLAKNYAPGGSKDPAGTPGASGYDAIPAGGAAPRQTPQIPAARGMTAQDQPGQSVAGYPGLLTPGSLSPDIAAKMAGVDLQQLQKEYADYQQHLQKVGAGDVGDRTGSGMSFDTFADLRATAVQGIWRPVLDQLDMYYQQQTNTEMPVELRMQLLGDFEAMKTSNPVVYQQIRTNLLNYQMAMSGIDSRPGPNYGKPLPATTNPQGVAQPFLASILSPQQESINQSLSSGVIGTGSAASPGLIPSTIWARVNDYTAAHPTAATIESTQAKESASRQASYVKLLADNNMSQYATPDLMAKLMKMSDEDAQKYIGNSFPYKMGMTLQQWTDAENQFKSFSVNGQKSSWQQIFGGTPSDQQIASARGMSGDQFSQWIENSPSRIQGVNVGAYVADKSAMDGIAQQLFGTGATDELLRRYHQQGKEPV